MKERIQELTEKLKTAKGSDETKELFLEVSALIEQEPTNIHLLHLRGELNIKLQNPALAINDYNTILTIDPKDQIATFQVEQLKTILKFNNTDIYANPNTNLDPWMD
jgi:hypothetical protein